MYVAYWRKSKCRAIYQELGSSNTTLLWKTALRELTEESKQLGRNNYSFLKGGEKEKEESICLWVTQLWPHLEAAGKSAVYVELSPIVIKLMTARAVRNTVCTFHCLLYSLKSSAVGCLSPSLLFPLLLPHHILSHSPSRKAEWADQDIQPQELGWNQVLMSEDWKLWNQILPLEV